MLKTFDTLYKRTKTGAIQFWEVGVTNDPAIIKSSGKLGTDKPLIHTEHIHEGKQKRTPVEQAEFIAESDWKKKHDEGYKSLVDLGLDNIETIEFNFPNKRFEEVLETCLPQFNTDASGQLKPMLAPNKPWAANGKTKYPQQLEIKMDGLRSTIVMSPEETTVLSRSGKPYSKLIHLIAILDAVYPKETRTKTFILDGELYKHGLSLQAMNKAVRGENEHTDTMQFWVYDLPTVDSPQAHRSSLIQNFIEYTTNHPDHPGFPEQYFHHNPSSTVHSDEEVLKAHDELVNQGYEGAMLKDPNGTYQPGQRSKFWQKVKMFEDNEYIVTGHELGQRGVQDLMFWCNSPGGPFKVVMNGTLQEKEELYAVIETLAGKQLTVRHFGYTEYNIPNLGKGKAFREDADLS